MALASACGRPPEREAGRGGGADTTREGRTAIVRYDDGPVDELRLVRDTAGGIVVHGTSGLPDGARVTIQLLRAEGSPALTADVLAATRATVELGRFQGHPLVPVAGPVSPGRVRVRLWAAFRPGEQTEAVLHHTARGRSITGRGMTVRPEGYAVYEEFVEVDL